MATNPVRTDFRLSACAMLLPKTFSSLCYFDYEPPTISVHA
jgi:hypothetical protein